MSQIMTVPEVWCHRMSLVRLQDKDDVRRLLEGNGWRMTEGGKALRCRQADRHRHPDEHQHGHTPDARHPYQTSTSHASPCLYPVNSTRLDDQAKVHVQPLPFSAAWRRPKPLISSAGGIEVDKRRERIQTIGICQ